ncbi:MAG: SRPBCC domain-containing protein [Blastocatellia bacterium]|nr:SRPBCC domain-containing protein [Blastocatellia bacterium]
MMTIKGSTATSSDRELVIDRVFDAPRAIVFEAWTRAEHLVRWFGPSEFTLPSCEIDFRIGGSYRFCMRSPEGEDHWVWGEYREIVEPERIVMTWNRDDAKGEIWSSTVVTLSFAEDGGRTSFTLHQSLFETVPYRDEHGIGWGQALDRLDSHVNAT